MAKLVPGRIMPFSKVLTGKAFEFMTSNLGSVNGVYIRSVAVQYRGYVTEVLKKEIDECLDMLSLVFQVYHHVKGSGFVSLKLKTDSHMRVG